MTVPTMTADEGMLRRLVGTQRFLLGREFVRRGEVTGIQHHEATGRTFGQVGGPGREHSAFVLLVRDGAGDPSLLGACTCKPDSVCEHAVAVLLAGLAPRTGLGDPPDAGTTVVPPADWER